MLSLLLLKSGLLFLIQIIPKTLHTGLLLTMRFFLVNIPPFLQPQTEVGRKNLRLIYGSCFFILIVIGLTFAEYKAIYINATTLCLSCIGIK